MTSSGRLARIYVSSEDDVDVTPFLSHFGLGLGLVVVFMTLCSGGKPVVEKRAKCTVNTLLFPSF